jgi:hypothetical protein
VADERETDLVTAASTINIGLLRRALERCLDECERQLGSDIDLEADHYWIIDPSDAFDLTSAPEPVVGQISDDIDSIQSALARPADEPYFIWHEVGHLLGPLTRLASLTV